MADDYDESLDSFEAELEGLLLQDHKIASGSLEMRLRADLPASVEERLELAETLGTGGSGAVIRAIDRDTGAEFALKLLRVEGVSASQRARIKREYRAGRRLSHPHVVGSDEFFEGDAVWAFTMELMQGSLRRRLGDGNLPWETVAHVGQEVLAALDYVHSEHVVHRDLKPENILFGLHQDELGPAKLADFGIARFGELGSYTSPYGLTGTPAYMPPEAFEERRFDPRGDLYALGIVLLEMLNGSHPIDTKSDVGWPRRHRELSPIRPAKIPDALWELIVALLQTRPEARPKTARDAFEVLASVIPPRVELPPLRGGVYVASTALIGRDTEVAAATTWLEERFSERGPPILWLTGPAGMGKSRLLQQFANTDEATTLLFGRGERHVRRPFSSLSSVLNLLGRRSTPADLSTHHTIEPTQNDSQTTERSAAARQPVDTAHRAFLKSVIDDLLAKADEGPLLLIVEDVQWSDESSVQLLGSLARALTTQSRPAAVLVTSRPLGDEETPVHRLQARLRDDGLVQELPLDPLPLSATTELVGALLMDDEAALELATRLHESGTTTPLHVVQTLHVLLSRGALDSPEELALAQLPQTVHNAVGERAAHLSGVAKAILAMGAILGSEFTVAELASCLEDDELTLLDYLDEAEQRGFVSQSSSAAEVYRFVHEELRGALLSGLDHERRQLHRRAARGLIEVYDDPDRVASRAAYHHWSCEDWPQTWDWGRRAGRVALGQYGFRESARHFERAFDAATHAGIEPDAEAWRLWGDALMFNDRNADAARAFEKALERLPEGDSDREVVLLARLAELEYRSSRLTHALEPLEALLPRLGASVARDQAELEASLAALDDELTGEAPLEPVAPEDELRLEVLCHTFRNLAEVAYYFRAARQDYYAAETVRLALRLGDTNAAAQGFGLFAFLSAQAGRYDRVDLAASRAAVAYDRCEDAVARMFTQSMFASAWVMAGEPARGLVDSTAAWEIAKEIAEPLRLMTVSSVQSLSLTAVGRTDEATEVANTMHQLGKRNGYTRVTELSYVCGAAAALYDLDFERVLDLTEVAADLEATGSRMIALQLRSYRAVAQAFLAPEAGPEEALRVAEEWAREGFGSMLCNVDSNALLAGAITVSVGGSTPGSGGWSGEQERMEECIRRGWEPSHRNRAKTGLFLAAAGLFRQANDTDDEGWLDQGVDLVRRRGLDGDVALIGEVRERTLGRAVL